MHRKERKREKVQEVEGRKKNERQVQKQLVVLLQQQQRSGDRTVCTGRKERERKCKR